MYDARQIANWFVERAAADGRRLTIMELLKLVYISHGWYLEMSGGPLIPNKVEAWKHGPVIPDVYKAFRSQGVTVGATASNFDASVNSFVENVLGQIYSSYGKLSARTLSEITHEPDGPWDVATKRHGYFAPITNDVILAHYQMKRQKAQPGQNG